MENVIDNMHNQEEIPPEVLDLVRFLAESWATADEFIYKNCKDGDAIFKYPVIQGTRNQIDLKIIGCQEYDLKNIRIAVNWMIGKD